MKKTETQPPSGRNRRAATAAQDAGDVLEARLLTLIARPDYIPANVPELLRLLDLAPNRQQVLQAVLRGLEAQGQILRTKGNRYISAPDADLVAGVISINRAGKGFLQPDEAGLGEVVIPEFATGTALHGDRVLVRREVMLRGLHPLKDTEMRGTVVRILERKRSQFVGTLQRSQAFLYVIPDDPRLPRQVFVPPPRDVGRKAHPGDKVVVEIVRWESRDEPPEGQVIEVLGAPDAEGVDMLSVLRNYDLPLHFPKRVLQEADAIAKRRQMSEAVPEDLEGRVDCREDLVITIDPDDAKDFDDAICVQRVSKDQVRLWVHIADVAHYVKPGSALDSEARKRGNSTYLVDRVIPMLPEALSNELCSLKPEVDRLTKCVEFLLSGSGTVIETKFYPAVIRSKHRFTYQEVLERLQRPPSRDPIERMLHLAHELAQRIRHARFKAGSLDLDFPENKIRLDEKGRVKAIDRIENDISHQLIEEFMLLANEAVAARLRTLRRPALFRIHEAPKPGRLEQFRDDVLSHRVPCGNLTIRAEVQRLLQRFASLPIGPALKIGFLRSMMRARYAVEPLGHYGLAKSDYTHFTSPIRRYADLIVHRLLYEPTSLTSAALKEIADHISATERNSADAERDSREVKLYAHLTAQLKTGRRERYAALVTDVRNYGFTVDVPALGLSGLVHLSSIQDDFFVFDPTTLSLLGRHRRRVIKLGDSVTVEVCRVDAFQKQVDFQLAGTARGAAAARRPERGEHVRHETASREQRHRARRSPSE